MGPAWDVFVSPWRSSCKVGARTAGVPVAADTIGEWSRTAQNLRCIVAASIPECGFRAFATSIKFWRASERIWGVSPPLRKPMGTPAQAFYAFAWAQHCHRESREEKPMCSASLLDWTRWRLVIHTLLLALNNVLRPLRLGFSLGLLRRWRFGPILTFP